MEGLEATSLEGMVEDLAAVTVAKDHLAIITEGADMGMEDMEVEAEAEAHLDHHRQVIGQVRMTGMAGKANAVLDSFMSKARSLMRRLLRVLNISTPAYQVGSYGARKCATT
jgi:hypothetical protein